MYRAIGLLLLLGILVLACSQHGEWNTSPTGGSKTLAITMPLGVATEHGFRVTRVHVTIERDSFSDSMNLTIQGDTASGVFINLEPGTYTITVECYDGETLIAEGTGEGEVIAGETTTVNIELAFYVGNLEIIVDWPGYSGGIPTEGLVAYYPFNGDADDESGNGNDGVVEGATLTTDRFGVGSSAYAFDGTDDFIRVADFPRVNLGFRCPRITGLRCPLIVGLDVPLGWGLRS